VYHDPAWTPLPEVASGTWVDVPIPEAAASDADLQMLAVRFVDAGHPEKRHGPRFRVWFRNTSKEDLATEFNVMVVAANDTELAEDLPQAGVRVESIKASEIQSVDLRLPWEVYEMGRDPSGKQIPFGHVHVLVDSHGEIDEAFEENNGTVLARGDILPVDPAAFSTNADTGVAGQLISIAGEGFGPEPGQVLVLAKGLELQAEIQGWYDLGVRAKLPVLPLAETTEVDLIVVRGDGAASNALKLRLAPAGSTVIPAPSP